MEKITLNGFETVFDVLTPGPKNESETEKDIYKDINNDVTEELTDEELENIKNKKNDK